MEELSFFRLAGIVCSLDFAIVVLDHWQERLELGHWDSLRKNHRIGSEPLVDCSGHILPNHKHRLRVFVFFEKDR